jgi:hypothetical protein
MTISMNHEKCLIESFVHPDQKERFLALLSNPKKRHKLVQYFAHNVKLDSRYSSRIPAGQHSPDEIEKVLKAKGAGDNCYAFSENSRIDGKELKLRDALQETIGYGMGTFLSIIPGRLAYFEGEDTGERYILFIAAA